MKMALSIAVALLLIMLIALLIHKQVKEHYLQDDPMLNVLHDKFKRFFDPSKKWQAPLQALNGRDIMSEIDLYRGNKSYTINKKKVYLCLKDENKKYYNINMLVYVLAHEIAHVINNDVGHTESFARVFDDLLDKMVKEGIYDPTMKIDENYCSNGDGEVSS